MSFYKAVSGTRDFLFGSSDLRNRKYDQFLEEAKTIGDSLRHPGSKISWSPGKTPSYDLPCKISLGLFDVSIQGAIRKVKDYAPGFIANGLNSSQNALEWAQALKSIFVLRSDEDKRYFELAQRAFIAQGNLYKKEFEKSKELVDKEASKNYMDAARILGQFTYKKEVETQVQDLTQSQACLTPGEFKDYTRLKAKMLNNQPWFQALEGVAREQESMPLIAENERSLLLLVPSQKTLEASPSDEPEYVSIPSSSSKSFDEDEECQDLFNYGNKK